MTYGTTEAFGFQMKHYPDAKVPIEEKGKKKLQAPVRTHASAKVAEIAPTWI